MQLENFQQEIKLLKYIKSKKPWYGSYSSKKAKFTFLLDNLCELHCLDKIKLLIPEDRRQHEWSRRYYGDCCPKIRRIRIRNFSIITLLHEFKHWLDYNTTGLFHNNKIDEWRANYYSTYRFYYVWPEKIDLLNEMFTEQNISVYAENYKVDVYLQAIEDLVQGKIRF
jgi:hypothetical protein